MMEEDKDEHDRSLSPTVGVKNILVNLSAVLPDGVIYSGAEPRKCCATAVSASNSNLKAAFYASCRGASRSDDSHPLTLHDPPIQFLYSSMAPTFSNLENARDITIGEMTNINASNYYSYNESSAFNSAIKVLHKHVAAGALHDSAERCDAPKCHPDTRVAVQGEMGSWIVQGDRDDDPKEIMWMTGPAGSGKTSIMGSVADTCRGEGNLAGTFFFSSFSGSPDRRSKRCLVPTLAYQLVQHKTMSQVSKHILSAVKHNPAVFEQKLEVQLDELILEPLRACQNDPQRSEWPKAIMIDGLDECEADQHHDVSRSKAPRSKEDDQTEILSILKKAADDPNFPFRIIIASRPEHAIRTFFTDVAKSVTREVFLDEKYNPDADMTLFLQSKFANIRRRYCLPPSWPSKDVPLKLVSNASGQFIYVATVGRFIEQSEGDPNQLLNQVLQLPCTPTSTDPFAPLDTLYSHILNAVGSSESPHKILWLNLIFRDGYLEKAPPNWGQNYDSPIPPPAAAFVRLFLGSYSGQELDVFRNLNSLVSVPPVGDLRSPYTLYHKSLIDFLVSERRSGHLYIEKEIVRDFFISRYMQLWKSKGPQYDLNSAEEKLFLAGFFSGVMTENVFRCATGSDWRGLGKTISSDDVDWWVRSVKKQFDSNAVFCIDVVFRDVHKTCCWYSPCLSSCRLIRSNMIKALKASNWKTPSRLHLLRHRFFHLKTWESGILQPGRRF